MRDDLHAIRRIDAICNRFEVALQAGQGPAIEAYLNEVVEAERAELLRELLKVEIYHRQQGGQPLTADEYHARFPGELGHRPEMFRVAAHDLAAFLRGELVLASSGTATRLLGAVLRESRYTEVMRLWSGIWMGLAVNAFLCTAAFFFLLWHGVQDNLPYVVLCVLKMFGDWGLAWLLRVRKGPPILPVERTLVQIWIFFWINHFLLTWLYQRSGGGVAGFLPIVDTETALVFAVMASVLGGSFYITAVLCLTVALLNALAPGIGYLVSMFVISPYFFCLGWKHRKKVAGP